MPHTFDYFQHDMTKNSNLKITRLKWRDKNHYIFWDDMRKAYAEHTSMHPNVEWYWDDLRTAYEDLTTSDWRIV